MGIKFLLFVLFVILLVIPFSSAATFVMGKVNNAKDGTTANGREVLIWNQKNGVSDHLSDVIGMDGSSGVNNSYLFDCELLRVPCERGDTLLITVIPSKDKYQSRIVSVTVGGEGFIVSPDMQLVRVKNHLNRFKNILYKRAQILRK